MEVWRGYEEFLWCRHIYLDNQRNRKSLDQEENGIFHWIGRNGESELKKNTDIRNNEITFKTQKIQKLQKKT